MLDLAIVGGGPAGLTAGLYATRGGLTDVVLFELGMPGGQITSSSEVENYPGIVDVVTGMELMEKWPEQATRFGLKIEMESIERVEKAAEGHFRLLGGSGKVYEALSVIVATGSVPKRAGFVGEDRLFGRGISTCATCDGFFYKNREVAVIGGGDAALEEALYLAKICKKVTIIHRRETFRAAPPTVERVMNEPKIELLLGAKVIEAYGEDGVDGLKVDKGGELIDLKVPGVFVFVGRDVQNGLLQQADGSWLCELNERGEVKVDLKMRSSVAGLFAAGDVRQDAPRQVVCAAGDGAAAALSAIAYVEHLKR